jgi:hypothetical protein
LRWRALLSALGVLTTGCVLAAAAAGATGRWVAYQSKATNIVPFDGPNFGTDVYLWHATTAASSLVTTSIDAGPAHGSSLRPDISDNGRYIGSSRRRATSCPT